MAYNNDLIGENPDSFELMKPKKTQGTAANTSVQTAAALNNPALEKTNPGGNLNTNKTIDNLIEQIQNPSYSLEQANSPKVQEELKKYTDNYSNFSKPLFDNAKSEVNSLYKSNPVIKLDLSNSLEANKGYLDQTNNNLNAMNRSKDALAQRFNYFFDQYTGLSDNLGQENSLFSMFKNKGLQKQAFSGVQKTQDQQVDIFKKELESALQKQFELQKQDVGLNEKQETFNANAENQLNQSKSKDLIDLTKSEASSGLKSIGDALSTVINRNPETAAKTLEQVNFTEAKTDLVKEQKEKIKAEKEQKENAATEYKFLSNLPTVDRIKNTSNSPLTTVKQPGEGKAGVYKDKHGFQYDPGNDSDYIRRKIDEAYDRDKKEGKVSKSITNEKNKLLDKLESLKINNDPVNIRNLSLSKAYIDSGDYNSAITLIKNNK